VGNQGARTHIQVLGPIRVTDDAGRDITPSGGLQRTLLALLVLHRGQIVSVDSAIDALWPTALPADPAAALQNHLSRLRRGLPADLIGSFADGYRLDPALVTVDADELATALADGVGPSEIDRFISRWHGPAYPELADVDAGLAEAARLDELRWRAAEQRAAHRLAAGDTDGLVAELQALTAAQPLREQPRALLLDALVATGRHADALRAYDDFRRLLADELGIEPSAALAARHASVLAGGPAPDVRGPRRLPRPTTNLIGRATLLADLAELAGAHRLLTMVGPGGVGKTRLLLEVGHRLQASAGAGTVALCELATATCASALEAVAEALRIDARPGQPLDDRIAEVLDDRPVTLLLDNCEHVLDPTARLVDHLLTRCPNVRVVATSRERLRVAGEMVRPVPPLGTESDDAPAVQLFVQRARAVQADFGPDRDQLGHVAEVVRRLDGLPLAIELAAARLHTHDLAEIAAGLDQRFALLADGYRTSERHASLRATVSWSFGLLDEPRQRTFAQLSVFAGAFTVEDAAAICDLSLVEARTALADLVERSLVTRTPERRYALLETLREFGADQLAQSATAEEVASRHAHHFIDWTERARNGLSVSGQPVFAEIDDALPELRAAIAWLTAHDVEGAGRLVSALLDYGVLRLRADVLSWSHQVIAADPDDRSPHASVVWVAAAYAAWMAGDIEQAGRSGQRALAVAEEGGEPASAEICTVRGNYELFRGRLAEAAEWHRRGAEAPSSGGDVRRLLSAATAVLDLGYANDPAGVELGERLLATIGDDVTPHTAYVWYCVAEADLGRDHQRARERFTRALQIAELTDTTFVIGIAGASKASIDARFGDPHAAAADYRWLLEHWRRAGMWSTQWTILRSIAQLLHRLGRHADAAVLAGAVRAPGHGHEVFGADAVALDALGIDLRVALGDERYEQALSDGARLDAASAVEHALRSL
jgi:predicted ATPase/DNA-binding SARP family transcriptional activator